MIEAALVAVAGAAGGVLCAVLGTALLARTLPADSLPPHARLEFSPLMVSFAVGVAGLAALIATVVPAWRLARSAPAAALQPSRTVAGSRATRRARSALVGAEVTLAFVLAAAAILFARTVAHLQHVELGFTPDRLVPSASRSTARCTTRPRRGRRSSRAGRAAGGAARRHRGQRDQPPAARRRSVAAQLRGRGPAARRAWRGRPAPSIASCFPATSRRWTRPWPRRPRLHRRRPRGKRAGRHRQPTTSRGGNGPARARSAGECDFATSC